MIQIERFCCNMLAENCYVISDETKECAIIDCGAYDNNERTAIIEYIRQYHLKPVLLLGTHGHLDHHFGDNTVFEEFQLRPIVHKGDADFMEKPQEIAASMFGMQLNYELPSPQYSLNNGDKLTFGNTTLRVIATPGHSKGSVCFYNQEENILFTGDTLFKGSIGRTDFPGGSMFQMVSSLRLLAQLPDSTRIYAGHGENSTIGYEVAHNPYMDR